MTANSDNIDPYRAYKARQGTVTPGAGDREPQSLAARAAASSAAQWQREKLAEAATAPAREAEARERQWLRLPLSYRFSVWWADNWGVAVSWFLFANVVLMLVADGHSSVDFAICSFSRSSMSACLAELKSHSGGDRDDNDYRAE